ncbi:MAG: DNA polymerase III subunit beta [Bacteroidales bacterium]|nr:DNA polymerase III subunit beta [Bacteroidales bacterium]MDD6622429.1 DNA polymerase III subunit beta [Bacteroidales bacterium]MDD6669559.1 DNA polymerase III subunit beta [Bacteroidales bacterium]
MQFNINSKTLLTHMLAVSKVVSTKNSIDVLNNFLFEVKGETLTIIGSDKENTLVARIPVSGVEGEASFAVNVKKMVDLFKEMPAQGITFEVDTQTYEIKVKCLNGTFNIVGIDGGQFPRPKPQEDDVFSFTIPSTEVPKSLDKTVFAAGTDTMRPIMMGVLWDIKPDSIVFVASDTHKLVRFINSAVKPGLEGSFILPIKPANVLASILEKKEDKEKKDAEAPETEEVAEVAKPDNLLTVKFDSKSVVFENETYTLECRFISGKYPNYGAVIPQSSPFVIALDKSTMLNVVKRVSIFATDGGLIQLTIADNKVLFQAQDPEMLSSGREYIPCDYDGAPLTMGFNKDCLIDVLNNLSVNDIYLKITDTTRPGVFVPQENKENEDWLVLVMPMMVPR